MSKLSKTAAASMKGGPAEIKKDPFDTNEKKIRDLRVQRENKLAVIRYDFIDALIEAYDAAQVLNVSLLKQVADGEDKNSILVMKLRDTTDDRDGLVQRLNDAQAQSRTDLSVLKQVSTARDEIAAELSGLRCTLSEAANT